MVEKRTLCVGLCNLDIIQVCEQFPLEDSDQRSTKSWWQRGGNASNNCTVLALLGAKCELLATFSDSEHFLFAIRDLQRRGISTENCVFHEGREIPLSTVWLSANSATRTIVHSNPNLPELTVDEFRRCNLKCYSWIHFEGRRSVDEIAKMIDTIKQWNKTRESPDRITVSVDLEKPRDSNSQLIPNVDIIFLGKDFARFLGYNTPSKSVHGFKKRYPGSYTIICPWGNIGVSALDQNNKYLCCGVYPPTTIQDSLGAGDTFCAGCIFQLNQGNSLQKAIEYGSQLAGLKIEDFGFDHLKDKIDQLK
ncbi:ketohexokinase-like isoform X2 [Malaya genurostris]|uniref:ketohexokinase-like isoform X2 n=1 Tax=Malaya genurostris TaxID=325434 RepID=UPI0026F3DA4E|nr:ketohexokinase-like isoform X2 [Malaya genurostris]XP_058449873.1 ketohexokinase-like isoform X2 [Malaya genurostris]